MESRIGAMMTAAVIAATETEPIARCSTAATNQASRMLRITGAFETCLRAITVIV